MAGALLDREGLTELGAALPQGEANAIVAYAVDRLSRSQNHIGILFDKFDSAGVTMESVTERFEDTAAGRFILAARAFIAEVEREKIAERTMRGKAERARSGRIPQATGRGLYGYHYDQATGRRVVTTRRCRWSTVGRRASSPTTSRAASCSRSTPSTPPTTTHAASSSTASPAGSPTTARSGFSPTGSRQGKTARTRSTGTATRSSTRTVLSRAGNNSPRGLWSDGAVMYVADESDARVYTYNMPDALDARLASLSLSGVDFGDFSAASSMSGGSMSTSVRRCIASAVTVVCVTPSPAAPSYSSWLGEGYQVALEDLGEITVTVTSADGSRERVYRVRLGEEEAAEAAPEEAVEPAPEEVAEPAPEEAAEAAASCLRGDIAVGFSLVAYAGGSIEDLWPAQRAGTSRCSTCWTAAPLSPTSSERLNS